MHSSASTTPHRPNTPSHAIKRSPSSPPIRYLSSPPPITTPLSTLRDNDKSHNTTPPLNAQARPQNMKGLMKQLNVDAVALPTSPHTSTSSVARDPHARSVKEVLQDLGLSRDEVVERIITVKAKANTIPSANATIANTPNANTPNANTPNANTPNANTPNVNTPNVNTTSANTTSANSTKVNSISRGGISRCTSMSPQHHRKKEFREAEDHRLGNNSNNNNTTRDNAGPRLAGVVAGAGTGGGVGTGVVVMAAAEGQANNNNNNNTTTTTNNNHSNNQRRSSPPSHPPRTTSSSPPPSHRHRTASVVRDEVSMLTPGTTGSIHPPYQYTLLIHPINTSYQLTLTAHNLSTHPLNTSC